MHCTAAISETMNLTGVSLSRNPVQRLTPLVPVYAEVAGLFHGHEANAAIDLSNDGKARAGMASLSNTKTAYLQMMTNLDMYKVVSTNPNCSIGLLRLAKCSGLLVYMDIV